MVIKKINSLDKFKKMQAYWNHLLQASGSNHIHSTFEWLYTWWKYFGKDKELFILVAEENKEIIGIAPLMIEKAAKIYKDIMGLKRISLIGTGFESGFTDSADIIIVKKREKVLSNFLNFLDSNNELWDEILLTQVSSASPNFHILKSKDFWGKEYHRSLNELVHSPYLSIAGDFDTYFKSLGKSWRRDINKKMNRLKKEKPEAKFIAADTMDEILGESIYNLNLERNKASGWKSMFLDPVKYSFLKEIIPILDTKRQVKFFVILDRENVAAYQFAFDYNDVMYLWNTSYSPYYSRYSIGTILHYETIKYCFDNNYRICDFMVGDEDYKYHWTSSFKKNFIYHVEKQTIKTKINRIVPVVKNIIKAKIK